MRKIGWSTGALILNCRECQSAREKIIGEWNDSICWSAGALNEYEVECWRARKKVLEGWSAVTPGPASVKLDIVIGFGGRRPFASLPARYY